MIIDNGGLEGIISGPGNPPDSWGAGKDYRDIVGKTVARTIATS
jgi:hypothetical protein